MKPIAINWLPYLIILCLEKISVLSFKRSIKSAFITCCMVLFYCTQVVAQSIDSTQGTFAINAQFHYGYLVPHRPAMIGLLTGHTVGFELNVIKPTDGSKTFERIYNYPELGISYCFFNLGNETTLGNAQAIYPFISFPLARSKRLDFNLRLGGGIGYVELPFERYDNFKNIAIGSHINGVMSLRAELQFRIASRGKLAFCWGLTHWSNGSAATPNLGINVTTMGLSYQHFFGEQKKLKRDSLPPLIKKIRTSFFAAAFHKEIYPAAGDKYFVATISGNVAKVISRKSSLGLGVDFFYNEAIIESLKRDGDDPVPADAWRGGLHLGYMLSISDFDIVFDNGVYLFGELTGDTYIYTRIGMRQKITRHLFLCANLKTHFAKADFFEFGIGYEL